MCLGVMVWMNIGLGFVFWRELVGSWVCIIEDEEYGGEFVWVGLFVWYFCVLCCMFFVWYFVRMICVELVCCDVWDVENCLKVRNKFCIWGIVVDWMFFIWGYDLDYGWGWLRWGDGCRGEWLVKIWSWVLFLYEGFLSILEICCMLFLNCLFWIDN